MKFVNHCLKNSPSQVSYFTLTKFSILYNMMNTTEKDYTGV
jgi:hypothetical protein